MLEFLSGLFDSSFMPHGHCYQWEPAIVGLHVFSDSLIALAYFSIPFFLLWFVRRRKDLVFKWIFVLFGVFILASGTTHLLEVWTVWHGTYRLTGVVKLITAAASVGTAVMLGPLVPRALTLPTPSVLQNTNELLEHEVQERRQAEEALRRLNTKLEERVRERTAELEERNRQLQREIADRRQAEHALIWAKEEAEAANRVKTSFLANMSHEIRTPLTSIIGFAGVLAKKATGQQREFAELIARGGHRLLDTLNAVLTLAKLESTREEILGAPVDVNEAVLECIRLLQPNAEQHDLYLRFEAADEPVWAILDYGALHSILNNLVGNAVKFTEEGGVTVRVTTSTNAVYVSVSDTGQGIDRQFLPHLFGEFTQQSSGISRSHEGSGLGLSITKRLVTMLDGTIDVASTPGEGSTFTVTFPRVAPPDEQERTTIADQDPYLPGESTRLLVVDDNTETRALMKHVLGNIGDVDVATDATSGLALVHANTYDAILLDINLGPGATGKEVLHRLRADPSTRGVPVVAVTAYALPGDREQLLEEGFDAYLSKPFESDALSQLVRQLLRQREA